MLQYMCGYWLMYFSFFTYLPNCGAELSYLLLANSCLLDCVVIDEIQSREK